MKLQQQMTKAQEPRRAGALVLRGPAIPVADFYSGALAELCSGVDMVEGGSQERPHNEPGANNIYNLIDQLMCEDEEVRQLVDACRLDAIGRRTVDSVRRLLIAAHHGIDGSKPRNREIAVDEEGLRTAIKAASRSAFAPEFEGDTRKRRIDVDPNGGPASRACLQLFREKLKFKLVKVGFTTESLTKSLQRSTGAADQSSRSAKK